MRVRFIIGVFIVALAGCRTIQQSQTNVRAAVYQTPKNRAGMTLDEAQLKAVQLSPGMYAVAVRFILGEPDETQSGTYGQSASGGAWYGVEWIYRWPGKRLSIVFHDSPKSGEEHFQGNGTVESVWKSLFENPSTDPAEREKYRRLLEIASKAKVEHVSTGHFWIVNNWSWYDF